MFSNKSKTQGSWLYLDRNSEPVVGGVCVLWYLVVVAVGGEVRKQVENVRLQHQELPPPVFSMFPDNLPENVQNVPDDNGIESQ